MRASDDKCRAFYARRYKYTICVWDAPDKVVIVLYETASREIVMEKSSLGELMLSLAIQGYDFNDINFNKVAMHPEVKKFLRSHRIDHLEWEGEDDLQEVVISYE